MADPRWVRLFEGCNFCVPSSHSTYLGPSSFYGLPGSDSNGAPTEEEIAGLRYAATCHPRPPNHSFSSFSFSLLIKKRGEAFSRTFLIMPVDFRSPLKKAETASAADPRRRPAWGHHHSAPASALPSDFDSSSSSEDGNDGMVKESRKSSSRPLPPPPPPRAKR